MQPEIKQTEVERKLMAEKKMGHFWDKNGVFENDTGFRILVLIIIWTGFR